MLVDIIRKVVPMRLRQDVEMLIASNVASSRFLAISFYYLLCGIIPPKMKLLPDGNCAITHNGFEMVKPKDGCFAYKRCSMITYTKGTEVQRREIL